MDARQTAACSRCGQSNPIQGLWCRHCGAPLPTPAGPASAGIWEDKGLKSAIDLYGRVLADLEDLSRKGEVSPSLHQSIKEFYTARLQEKTEQEQARQKAASLDQCIWSARSLAHSGTGRLQEALATLEKGIEKFPEEEVLKELALEVRHQIEKRDHAQRAVRAARNLLGAARSLMESSRFEEAEVRLKEALALDPSNREITATLDKVQRSLDEQRRRAQVPDPTAARGATEAASPPVLLPPAPSLAPRQESASPDHRVREWAATHLRAHPVSEPAAAFEAPMAPTTEDRTATAPSFVEEEDVPSPAQRLIESASQWSKILKPFLLDNVGWFIGVFLIIAGFVVLITSFWRNIAENQLLLFSLVYFSLVGTTGLFFALAYFMRVKHPELETSSNVLLIIVALLIPLVFAVAALTTLVPPA